MILYDSGVDSSTHEALHSPIVTTGAGRAGFGHRAVSTCSYWTTPVTESRTPQTEFRVRVRMPSAQAAGYESAQVSDQGPKAPQVSSPTFGPEFIASRRS